MPHMLPATTTQSDVALVTREQTCMHTVVSGRQHCLWLVNSTGQDADPGLALPMTVRGLGPTKMLLSCRSSPWHQTRLYSGSASVA